jgi:hypothetical protein
MRPSRPVAAHGLATTRAGPVGPVGLGIACRVKGHKALQVSFTRRLPISSGHTHGGQVRVMGWSPWIPSRYGQCYAYGHVVENGRDLIVSGGLGSHFLAGIPLRIGVQPEIVFLELGAATTGSIERVP